METLMTLKLIRLRPTDCKAPLANQKLANGSETKPMVLSSGARQKRPGLQPGAVNHQAAPHREAEMHMHMRMILITEKGGAKGSKAFKHIAAELPKNHNGEVVSAGFSMVNVS